MDPLCQHIYERVYNENVFIQTKIRKIRASPATVLKKSKWVAGAWMVKSPEKVR